MPTATPQAIGEALADLGRAPAPPPDAARPASSREAILALLESAPETLGIDDISKATGLHPNTVRTHLDVLHAAGHVARTREAPQGPGRPRWRYGPAPGPRSRHGELAADLLDQLADVASATLTREVAERWAAAAETGSPAPYPTADDAVHGVAGTLAELGFEAYVDAVGDRIELRACPYARLVGQRPVICDIHAELVARLLEGSGQPLALDRLDVWTRPGLCVAHVRRADFVPERSIPGRPAEATTAEFEAAPDHEVNDRPPAGQPSSSVRRLPG